jgi:short subunit dehydrogenase-like uncharacterized protein
MPTPNWMIYGANGYTGELIAHEAKRRGLAPILAGRNRERIESLGRELDLPARVVGLEQPEALGRSLKDVDLVLHCAGPFVRTSPPMLEACLATRTHYLDITGEIAVFESVMALDEKARAVGVVLLPGVGFDVVPTDCLAGRLAEALTDATHLELAFTASGGSVSRGTLKTMIEGMPDAGAVRENGKIIRVPLAFDSKVIEFSCGKLCAMTVPWGDVSTAFHSTGIPNIRVYSGQSRSTVRRARRMRPLVRLAGLKPVKRLLQWCVGRTVTGPDQATRDSARSFIWGRVVNAAGERVTGTLETPEAYAFTALSSLECVVRVLEGAVAPGAWTPSLAFGGGFVDELPGVSAGELARS